MAKLDFSRASAESLELLAKHGNQPNVCEEAKAEIARRLEAELLAFARAFCSRSLETLEERGSDRLDFFTCGVAGLREALHGAYQAGKHSVPEERSRAAFREWRRVAGSDAIRFEDEIRSSMPAEIAEWFSKAYKPAHFYDWLREQYLAQNGGR